ncbi:hypothetical protein ABZT06_44020 [Streptomyces sp. NPDC005483]|uniref:hypothetical protein n=1 Tax=Streptomyces sp. NPDC005483 TaxID=3154882 RepID=UPI0033AA2DDA
MTDLAGVLLGASAISGVVASGRWQQSVSTWVLSLRRELLDRTLIWNAHHLRHALSEYERFYNEHRTHRSRPAAAPLRALPESSTDPMEIARLDIRRHDRLGGVTTRTNTPLELRGRDSRHAQGRGDT